jgi:hypothetical protein
VALDHQGENLMRHLRILGIALAAALAVSAVAATSAFALYHSEIETTNLSGAQKTSIVFGTDVGNLSCTTAKFTANEVVGKKIGEKDFATEMLTFGLAFGKATGSGSCKLAGVNVEVSASANTETSTSSTKTSEPGWFHSNSHVESTTGASIIIKDTSGLGCEVAIPVQIFGGVKRLHDIGTGSTREVEAVAELTSMKYSWTANCPNAEGKAGGDINGTYSGTWIYKGENPVTKAQVGVWVE